MINVKDLLINSAVVLAGAALNFFVFLEAYKRLAFPYISEEQRVDNAPYIFIYIFPSFIVISIILFVLCKVVVKPRDKNC